MESFDFKSFIEVQFPVSKISKESYKERKANLGQTLTGLGKWWGRKPLVLVRATILGLLMPASNKPKKDMDIFLKIMTMDDNGLLLRRKKKVEQSEWDSYSYDKKLTICVRPEEVTLNYQDEWKEINAHLGTNATDLKELIEELSVKQFGEKAIVGDCFCGGGSIPFEAARMGCDVYASDLNPIAGLLTWADLNIAGASDDKIADLREFQQKVYEMADKQITDWGIETNEQGDRANSYLYCNETICPECGYTLPLAPSWVIGKGTMTIAILKENANDGFDIEIKSGCTAEEMKQADKQATVKSGNIHCIHCKKSIPVSTLRKDNANGYGLRQWEKDEFIPRESDVFKERLYCIKYTGKDGKRYYMTPTQEDFEREQKVIGLLSERFSDWQEKGYVPSSEIEAGDKTNEVMRTRGWKYWHQIFNPRQLLVHGLFMMYIKEFAKNSDEVVMGLLGVNKIADWNSKLCIWNVGAGVETTQNTYTNQALNTLYNNGNRSADKLSDSWYFNINNYLLNSSNKVVIEDARSISNLCNLWITDPPYADAVNYHELSEFFLAWDKKLLKKAFPDWYTDSKRVLAVKGRDETFNSSMIEIYKNLAEHMSENGKQVIMFTHQDVGVWVNLREIVFAAGLQVTAAWNIATETDSGGLKDGNYVKGTVLLVLRKRSDNKKAFIDELMMDVEDEVKAQIRSMRHLENKDEPNFTDADYILAAYAAAMKVLTSAEIADETADLESVIRQAKKIAYDYLVPVGFKDYLWKLLSSEERYYIKGLELEKNNIHQLAAHQELARGFGVTEYKEFMGVSKANAVRLKTPDEWAGRNLGNDSSIFAGTLLRCVFMALHLSCKGEENTITGKYWLKNEVADYWNKRELICEFLGYIATFEHIGNMEHWEKAAKVASILKELVDNDGV